MGQQVVLTGGASGIGGAAAARLSARGTRVTVLDIAPPADPDIEFLECDLAAAGSIERAVGRLPASIDALVNVAGVAGGAHAETVVAVNFLGLRHLTEALIEGRLGGGRLADGASIVNVASSAGRDWPTRQQAVCSLLDTQDFESGLAWLRENPGAWAANPYKFSKQCAAAYTYRAPAASAGRGLRINCVNPGAVETRLSPEFRQLIGSDMYDWIGRQVGRHGTPDDIAAVIEYLATGDCAWLNGVELTVDGGYHAGVVGGRIQLESSPDGLAYSGPSAAPGQ